MVDAGDGRLELAFHPSIPLPSFMPHLPKALDAALFVHLQRYLRHMSKVNKIDERYFEE